MAFNYPGSGQNNTAEYMASGLPFVTQSQVTAGTVNQINFPYVTIFFSVKNNTAGNLRVGFTRNGVLGSNFFTLPVSGTFESKIRVTDLFITAEAGTLTYEVVASLTGVSRNNFYILTGSYMGFSGAQASPDVNNRNFGYPGLG